MSRLYPLHEKLFDKSKCQSCSLVSCERLFKQPQRYRGRTPRGLEPKASMPSCFVQDLSHPIKQIGLLTHSYESQVSCAPSFLARRTIQFPVESHFFVQDAAHSPPPVKSIASRRSEALALLSPKVRLTRGTERVRAGVYQ